MSRAPGQLGAEHQAERRAALAALREGDPCPFCTEPMFSWQRLHLDHSVPRALGGAGPRRLAHGWCNESAGASLGNRLRGGRTLPTPGLPAPRTSREW